ncbi:GTP cyclohydrolase 1 type 2/Nif3 [Mycena rebaudengoi]|nr:GTP cyclohydrolase 1 type 2/Nif3 [Mycena rebaudengoi]
MPLAHFKLVFFSPIKNTSPILAHLFGKFPSQLGKIGDYEQCAFISRGTGQFKPSEGAKPAIGSPGTLEFVEEDRVEILVNDSSDREEVRAIIRELKKVHPYEEVAYDVYKVEDL